MRTLAKISPRQWLLLGLLTAVALLVINEVRPITAVQATQLVTASSGGGDTPAVPWPHGAQAALGGTDGGAVVATPGARPAPIASVAKVMAALVIQQLKPLKPGDDGPTISVGPDDVTEFQQDQAQGQSVVAVQAGEQLSERQALEALLIPSGNNIAALLARWAAGSTGAMVRLMNEHARSMGLTRTRFADVSGFSASTVSVPAELVRLGQELMRDPVLATIVSLPSAMLPVAGMVYNVDYVLGQDGIIGIKTGNVPQEGAIFLFAGSGPLASGGNQVLVGAVQGLPTLDMAFDGAKALLDAARTSLRLVHVVSENQTVGRYAPPWGGGSDVTAMSDLDVLVWPGMVVRRTLQATDIDAAVAARTSVGRLRVTVGDAVFDVPVATASQIEAPGHLERLTRVTW